MIPNATMFGVKNWLKLMLPSCLIRSFELSDPKITRKKIGNTTVKIALAGLRQKRFCSSTQLVDASRIGLTRGSVGSLGELQVDVFERRAR